MTLMPLTPSCEPPEPAVASPPEPGTPPWADKALFAVITLVDFDWLECFLADLPGVDDENGGHSVENASSVAYRAVASATPSAAVGRSAGAAGHTVAAESA